MQIPPRICSHIMCFAFLLEKDNEDHVPGSRASSRRDCEGAFTKSAPHHKDMCLQDVKEASFFGRNGECYHSGRKCSLTVDVRCLSSHSQSKGLFSSIQHFSLTFNIRTGRDPVWWEAELLVRWQCSAHTVVFTSESTQQPTWTHKTSTCKVEAPTKLTRKDYKLLHNNSTMWTKYFFCVWFPELFKLNLTSRGSFPKRYEILQQS